MLMRSATLADLPERVYDGRMGRAGGWILVLVAVVGMAAAALVGLRPILFRKTVTIRFYDAVQWTPKEEAAVRLAFEEKGFRAGSLRVEPAFVNQGKKEAHRLLVERSGTSWSVTGPKSPPSDPRTLYLHPHESMVGTQTARWVGRSGIKRVFLLRSAAFEVGFEREARASGIVCRSEFLKPQGHSLVESVLAADPELVILGRQPGPIVDALRKSGYSGKFLVYDDDFQPTHYSSKGSGILEGVFVTAAFPPVSTEIAAKLPSTSRDSVLSEYYGYRTASLVLEAIERADTDDHSEIYRALGSSPEFASDGQSTLPGALYVFRKDGLEFVEALK
jgi:hypothetical protein